MVPAMTRLILMGGLEPYSPGALAAGGETLTKDLHFWERNKNEEEENHPNNDQQGKGGLKAVVYLAWHLLQWASSMSVGTEDTRGPSRVDIPGTCLVQ